MAMFSFKYQYNMRLTQVFNGYFGSLSEASH